MPSTEPLWTRQQLEDRVHKLALDSSNIIFMDHCLTRLEQRGITAKEALRCLRRGSITRGPTYSEKHNSFEFRMIESPPRDIVCMVVSVKPVEDPAQLYAITVWEV